VRISDGVAFLTNEQYVEPLLCEDCEGRLSVWENVVSGLVVQVDGSFPWLAALPGSEVGKPSDSSALDTDGITRFASSVLWRASVSNVVPEAFLGPKYDEVFRRFLLGEAGFPPRTSLSVTLAAPAPPGTPRVDRVFMMPASRKLPRYHTHWFILCGVTFFFWVGGGLDPEILSVSFHAYKHVVVDDGEHVRNLLRRDVADSPAKGALARKGSRYRLRDEG
jgi:hypothetical protein